MFLHILYCGSAAEVLPDPVLPEQLESVFRLAALLDAARVMQVSFSQVAPRLLGRHDDGRRSNPNPSILLAQVLETFLAAMDISKLAVEEKELQWLLLADKYGARRLRGKILADLVPKLRASFTQYSLDGAWRKLSTDTQLLLVEAAFSSLATLESEVYNISEANAGAVSWEDIEALRIFPSEEDLARWEGLGGLHRAALLSLLLHRRVLSAAWLVDCIHIIRGCNHPSACGCLGARARPAPQSPKRCSESLPMRAAVAAAASTCRQLLALSLLILRCGSRCQPTLQGRLLNLLLSIPFFRFRCTKESCR